VYVIVAIVFTLSVGGYRFYKQYHVKKDQERIAAAAVPVYVPPTLAGGKPQSNNNKRKNKNNSNDQLSTDENPGFTEIAPSAPPESHVDSPHYQHPTPSQQQSMPVNPYAGTSFYVLGN
jgi:hypothetical protein